MKNLSDYSEFSLTELIDKISTSRYWNLPKMLAEAFRKLSSTSFIDAPSDGNQYARQDGTWTEVSTTSGGAF